MAFPGSLRGCKYASPEWLPSSKPFVAVTLQALDGCRVASLSWLLSCKPVMAVALRAFHGRCLARLSWLSRCKPFMAVVSQAFHGYGIETFHGHDLQTFRGSSFCICWKRVSQLLFPFTCSHLSLSRNPLATLPQPRLGKKNPPTLTQKPWCREYGLISAEKDFRIFAQNATPSCFGLPAISLPKTVLAAAK